MRNLRIASLCLLSIVLAAGSEPAAQQVIINGQPGGDIPFPLMGGQRQMKTGTGRIRGRVISSETGGPVRRAQVRISGPDIAAKTALTDADGRYEFRELPAGRFNLSTSKSGFVTVQYGQTRPFESGKALDLADAQTMEKADIQMPRGSVVSGRILDEFGDPVADANVSALRSTWVNGKRRLQPTGRMSQTNDLGQYRIYGLPPGDYYVSATFRGAAEMMAVEMMAMTVSAGGGGAGPSASNPNSGYAPTYFPGTIVGADAQKITLVVGQEAQSTDFALLPVKLAKVTGSVITSEGKPMESAMVNLVPRGGDVAAMLGMGNAGRTDKNGNFTINSVPPGDYNLQVRGTMQIMSSGDNTMVFQTRVTIGDGGGAGGGESEVGSTPVSVAGEDVAGVVLVTSKGATATGRVVFEGGTKPTTLTSIRISAMAADNEMIQMGGSMGTVKADGTFEMKGLGGTRILRAVGLPPGWMLKAVHNTNGADVTDTGIDFRPGEAVAGIDIVVTSKLTDLSGTVKGTDGQPAKDYTVVVFSDEPAKWLAPSSRYVTAARPNQDGRFQVKNLPAGGYYAVALEYVAQGEWGDPELLQRLIAKANKFSLDEGDSKTLDLKITQ